MIKAMQGKTRHAARSIAAGLLAAMVMGMAARPAGAAGTIGDPKPPPVAEAQRDSTTAPDSHLKRHATHAKSGGQAGMLAGAVAGGALFLLAAAYGDGEGGDIDTPGYIGLGLLGAALGGATGWLVGSFLGSTIPVEPTPVEPTPAATPAPTPPPEPVTAGVQPPDSVPLTSAESRGGRILASFTLLGGLGDPSSDTPGDGGALVGARLMSHRGEWVSFGPELLVVGSDDGLFTLTGDVAVGHRFGSLRPFGIGDLGWHKWRGDGASLFGAGVGGGLDWARAPGATAFGVEFRHRWTLQNDTEFGQRSFSHVAATARFSW